MKYFGCQSPFGYEIQERQICSDKDKAYNVSIYEKSFADTNDSLKENCPYPCNFMNLDLVVINDLIHSNRYLKISFPQTVKETVFEYSYGGLELLAEFGGFVGIFTGMSVLQLSSWSTNLIRNGISILLK